MVAPQKVVQLLEDSIRDANIDEPVDFDDWHESARMAMRLVYGEGRELKRFDDIDYSLQVFSSSTPDSAWDMARRDGVRRAVAALNAALKEKRLDLDDEPEVPVSGFLAPDVVAALEPIVKKIRIALEEVEDELDSDDRALAHAQLETVEVQLHRSPKPDSTIVERAFVLMAAIGMGVAGNVAYAGMTHWITEALKLIHG